LITCMQYIELNPVRAGLVKDPGDYKWSSYRCHALGRGASIWSPHVLYESLGNSPVERQKAYRNQMSRALGVEAISKIRHCVNTGLVLGTEAFRAEVEKLRS